MAQFIRILSLLITIVLFAGCGKKDDEAVRLIEERFTAVNDSAVVTADLALMSAIALTSGREDVYGAQANYLAGKIEFERMNFPAATRAFLLADRIAAEKGVYDISLKARLAMIELNKTLYNRKGMSEFGKRAYRILDCVSMSDSCMFAYYQDIIDGTIGEDKRFALSVTNEYAELAAEARDSLGIHLAGHYRFIIEYEDASDHWLEDSTYRNGGWIKFERFKSEIRKLPANVGFVLPDTVAANRDDIHDFVIELWRNGESGKASRFLNMLLERYKNEGMEEKWLIDFSYPHSLYVYALETPSCEDLLRTFQSDVDDEVRRSDYDEILIKERSISRQRVSIVILVFMLAIICLFGGYYFRVRLQRSRLREQELTDSVKELDAALRRSQKTLFRNVSSLCDAYYKSCVDGNAKIAKDTLKAIEEFVKAPDMFAELETVLNAEADCLMVRFRKAMPGLRDDEYRLFLCNALGFSVPALMMLLGEKREVIYNRRLRLRAKIAEASLEESGIFIEKLV